MSSQARTNPQPLSSSLQDENFIPNDHTFRKTTWNGLAVIKDELTGYYQASKACKDNGKRINDWLSNKETQEYLNAVSHEYKCQIEYDCTDAGIPAPGLLYRIDVSGKDLANGYAELQGYYIHPDLFHDCSLCEFIQTFSDNGNGLKGIQSSLEEKNFFLYGSYQNISGPL